MPSKLTRGAGRLGAGGSVCTAASGLPARRRARKVSGAASVRIARFSAASLSSSSSPRSVSAMDAAMSRSAGDSAKFTARAAAGPGPPSWAWTTGERHEPDGTPPSKKAATPRTSHGERISRTLPGARSPRLQAELVAADRVEGSEGAAAGPADLVVLRREITGADAGEEGLAASGAVGGVLLAERRARDVHHIAPPLLGGDVGHGVDDVAVPPRGGAGLHGGDGGQRGEQEGGPPLPCWE